MPNMADQSNAYTEQNNPVVDKLDQSNMLMESLRNEHTRVFMQDQALLKTIKETGQSQRSGDGGQPDLSSDRGHRSMLTAESPIKEQRRTEQVQVDASNKRGEIVSQDGVRQPPRSILDKYRVEEKKKDPIYQLKPLSIVEENMQYEYQELEENLIRYLLEKVITMRELPFMKATERLERQKNINKIYDQLIKIAPTNSFAGKQN